MSTARPTFIPWLFDSREAFEKAIQDPRYHYNMNFNSFINLYKSYRNGTPTNNSSVKSSPFNFTEPSDKVLKSSNSNKSAQSQILNQDEIDALILQAMG